MLGVLTYFILHLLEVSMLDLSYERILILCVFNSLVLAIPWLIYIITSDSHGQLLGVVSFVFSSLSFELLHTTWIFAFPWFNLGNSLAGCPNLIQWYEYTGVSGGSLWILLSNGLLFLLIYSIFFKSNKQIKTNLLLPAFIAAFVTPIIISNAIDFRYFGNSSSVLFLSSSDTDRNTSFDSYHEKLQITFNNIHPKIEFIVWPEGATRNNFPINFLYDSSKLSSIRADIKKNNRTWIIGTVLIDSNQIDYYNSALVLSSLNKPTYYSKNKLVPFAEFNPFPKFGGFSYSLFKNDKDALFTKQTVSKKLDNGFNISICYEVLFGEQIADDCRGNARLIFLISNEEWCSAFSDRLNKIASLRAIETRKFIVKSVNKGIPAVINPLGNIKIFSPKSILDCFQDSVIQNGYQTFYMKHGDYIGKFSVIMFVTILTFLKTKSK